MLYKVSHQNSTTSFFHFEYIRLEPHNIATETSIILDEDLKLVSEYSQSNINNSQNTNLTSIRNIFRSNTIWNSNQIKYIRNRKDPLSTLSNQSSSAEKLVKLCNNNSHRNFIYLVYDPTKELVLLNGVS